MMDFQSNSKEEERVDMVAIFLEQFCPIGSRGSEAPNESNWLF